jgi:uncharacterized protein YbjT (DUF2867 family)
MKVLILGGTGATGRRLCEKAAAAGHAVTALVRDSAAAKLSFPGVTIQQASPLRRRTSPRRWLGTALS